MKTISNDRSEDYYQCDASETCDDDVFKNNRDLEIIHPFILFRKKGKQIEQNIATNQLMT